MGIGSDGRLDDLFVSRLGSAILDVLPQCPSEQEALLHNHADVLPQAPDRDVAQVVTVNEHLAGNRIVEAGDEMNHRRLTAARWPY